YRLYLLDEARHVKAAENFAAPDDVAALEIACSLHSACWDIFPACDVWHGPKHVGALPRGDSPSAALLAGDADCAQQTRLLALVEGLQPGLVLARTSRGLVAATVLLRSFLVDVG